jgi:predicted DNA-binding transcriptional regulator AlpA
MPKTAPALPDTSREDSLVDVIYVAMRTSFDPKTIRRMAVSGVFPRAVKIGRSLRWKKSQIDKWIREQV